MLMVPAADISYIPTKIESQEKQQAWLCLKGTKSGDQQPLRITF